MDLDLAEEIKIIQNRLRIALKNHYILHTRLKIHPNDNLAMEHISVLQNVIKSLGKQQNEMLVLFKQDIAKEFDIEEPDMVSTDIIDKYLHWDIPKVLDRSKLKLELATNYRNTPSPPKNENISTSKTTVNSNKIKSLLSHKSMTKKQANKHKDDFMIDPSKVLNVYKAKDTKKPSILAPELKVKQKRHDSIASMEESTDFVEKISPTSSETPSDEDYGSYIPVKKMKMTRYRMKTIAAQNCIFSIPHNFSELIEGNELATDISEISQEKFLCFFGLVNSERSEVIKNKRSERKRRSVAGQSNFYSDYLQPQKRTYTRKSPSQSSSPTSQVVVETAVHESDEEIPEIITGKPCFVCKINGNTKECTCGEIYHVDCLKDKKCACIVDKSVESIVGGSLDLDNLVLSTPSSSEWVKRYQNNGTPKCD